MNYSDYYQTPGSPDYGSGTFLSYNPVTGDAAVQGETQQSTGNGRTGQYYQVGSAAYNAYSALRKPKKLNNGGGFGTPGAFAPSGGSQYTPVGPLPVGGSPRAPMPATYKVPSAAAAGIPVNRTKYLDMQFYGVQPHRRISPYGTY